MFAVPNGGSRNTIEAANLKRQGVLAGVSDLILMKPSGRYHGLCIEMKHGKNKLTRAQADWINAVNEQGYYATVCFSFEDFEDTINNYLSYGKL